MGAVRSLVTRPVFKTGGGRIPSLVSSILICSRQQQFKAIQRDIENPTKSRVFLLRNHLLGLPGLNFLITNGRCLNGDGQSAPVAYDGFNLLAAI